MLEKIVFLIVDETQLESAVKLKQNIDLKNNRIHIWGPGTLQNSAEDTKRNSSQGMDVSLEEKTENIGDTPRCLKDYDRETTLFVTDVSEIMRELKRQGKYVIGFLHKKNEGEDWSAASYAITDIEELEMDSFVKAYQRMRGEPWTILETERCIIRETTVEDVDQFYRIYAEPSITYYMEQLFEKPEEEKAYTKEYIEKVYGFYGYGMWSILHKETGRVIGRAGLSWREGYDIPEIGFVIEVPFQRKGYAYEVCSAIVEYGISELEFHQIQALVKAENEASVKLCLKLGFEYEDEVTEYKSNEVYDRYILKCE